MVLQDPGTSTGDSATNCNLPNLNSAIHCAFTFAAKTRGKRERIASPAHRERARARRGWSAARRPSASAIAGGESSCACTGSVFTLMAARGLSRKETGVGVGGRIKIYPRPQLMNGKRAPTGGAPEGSAGPTLAAPPSNSSAEKGIEDKFLMSNKGGKQYLVLIRN